MLFSPGYLKAQGMDPYSSPCIIPNTSRHHNPFPHSLHQGVTASAGFVLVIDFDFQYPTFKLFGFL